MSLSRALCAFLVMCAATAACSDEPTTSVAVPRVAEPVDLELTFPAVTNETLIHSEVDEVEEAAGPAAVLSDEDASSYEDPPPPPVASKIISASTEVGYQDGYAYSRARQRYTGNHGEISTTATVTYAGAAIGNATQSRQSTVPYLTDFGQEKQLVVETYVWPDQQCGLRVDGNSNHVAAWQWFLGTVANWGKDQMNTVGFPPYQQPPCEEIVEEPEAGSGGGGTESDGAEGNGVVTCWYLVTIDLQTGEIIDARFLYCDGVEEGG